MALPPSPSHKSSRCGLLLLWVCASAALTATGCNQGVERIPVTGKVLIDGKPLTHGRVQVSPSGARVAYGELDEQGAFTLTTYEPGDGTVPGQHPVTVSAIEFVDSNHDKWHAPRMYATQQSGLTITVDPDQSDEIVIELSWNGGKPFVVRNNVD